MLMPKRVKYRKQFRGRMKGKSNSGDKIAHGQYGLVALESAWITNRQIEAARIAMTRYIRRGGQVWIKIFPDKPVTAKPAETRMGSGKGSPEYWVAVVKPGRVLFEMAGVPREIAAEAMRLAGHKLPIKTKFIENEGQGDVYVPVVNETLADAKKAAHAAAVEEAKEVAEEAAAEEKKEGGEANEG